MYRRGLELGHPNWLCDSRKGAAEGPPSASQLTCNTSTGPGLGLVEDVYLVQVSDIVREQRSRKASGTLVDHDGLNQQAGLET